MVQQRLRAVFANLFQVDPARLSPTATPDEIDGWDSFGHLALVADACRAAADKAPKRGR